MKNIVLISFIFILCSFKTEQEPEAPEMILRQTLDKYAKHTSLSYSLMKKVKYLFNLDTITRSYNCKFFKDPGDDFLNGYIWISYDTPFEVFYDTDLIYHIKYERNTIYYLDSLKRVTEKDKDIYDENFHRYFSMAYNYFLNPDKILNFINDSSYSLKLETLHEKSKEYWKVSIYLADSEDWQNYIQEIYINKNNYLIDKISMYLESQSMTQYFEWNMIDQEFDWFDNKDLIEKRDSLIDIYGVEKLKCKNSARKELLHIGSSSPDIKGYNFQENKEFNLSNISGKLYLLDFFYLSCPPCLKAIPYMNEFHQKYKNDGLLVLGIDKYDNNDKKKIVMKKYLSKNRVDYPIILVDSIATNDYNVKAYPSLYLLDSNRKVLYSSIGFYPSKIVELDSIISKYLKNDE